MQPKPVFEIRYTTPDPSTTAASAARYAANRLNAQKSTGPRTDEGKLHSAKAKALPHSHYPILLALYLTYFSVLVGHGS